MKQQREIRQIFSLAIEGSSDLSPVYKLLLQLLFASEAGGNITLWKPISRARNHLELSQRLCPSFVQVLESLAPFSVNSLNTLGMDYLSPLPLLAIIRSSPDLIAIRLCSCVDRSVIEEIGKNCPKLELLWELRGTRNTFSSDEYLYRTFFCGMEKETVLSNINTVNNVNLSFPFLKVLDMWHLRNVNNEFFHVLLHFHPHLNTVTTLFDSVTADLLLPTGQVFGSNLRSPSDLNGISITVNHIIDSKNLNEIIKLYPKIYKLTINDAADAETPRVTGDKLKNLVHKINAENLVLSGEFSTLLPDNLEQYVPTFQVLKSKLKTLDFQLWEGEAEMICQLLNICENLESLRIGIPYYALRLNNIVTPQKPLHQLSSLAVWSKYCRTHVDSEAHALILALVHSAPNLTSLEINTGHSRYPFPVMKKVRSLTLIGESFCLESKRNFSDYQNDVIKFIEKFPLLNTLVLYMEKEDSYAYINHYKRTALNVLNGCILLSRDSTQYFLQ
ncbi:unnamed protein product [Meganyctiphanes norvegica]|uniref:Uncharacterized protein n=1 Tax=Meganyctiphanes norvegica TaxID=48144 RepID=A0AAV2QKA5_MEGNR